ncbi:DMT family transporter [Sphingorhabdus sp. IMCC26285]|jgi:drug/metabolite transporter (DMT)-like permease|uniref:DMT family transporter n=1 Tax=Sphingorhabdus profundilacus TaxID=2509718 RepID=A0A6I4M8C0_9SPHN|nr:DMT family transporter [Sphingorhabdus profundilacus]MVZ98365.1 DMT family transporter [Sphingorhabdus profundilacus]
MPTKIFHQQSPKALAFLALIAGNIAIAFGPLLVRYADSGPIATGFWRLALATPFLFLVSHRFGFRLSTVRPQTFLLVLIAGVFFGIDIIAWHIGIFQTKLGNATLFANCASLLLVIYGVVVARKLPGKWQIMSVMLAFVGAALLMGQSLELSPVHFAGDLLCLGAGLTYTIYLLMMMRVRENTESWGALAMASTVAALVLLPAALFAGEQILPAVWWPVLLLAFTSQFLGQGCLTYALPHFSPLVIGLALLLQPALSATAGWFAFGEALTLLDFTGSLLVMTALVLVRRQ